MESSTQVLRRLLDERGVKWTAPNSILRDTMTCWTAGGFYYEAFEVPEPDGTFLLTAAHQDDLTPEQVIAATLGAGTCRDMGRYCFTCSECGWIADEPHHMLGGFQPRYCPNCGARVVDPTTNDVDAEVDE